MLIKKYPQRKALDFLIKRIDRAGAWVPNQQENSMAAENYDEAQTQLINAIKKDAPCTFDEPIPVLVTLDNGVEYKGHAIEAQPESDDFPNGLVMVRTANSDIGVPVSYISHR
jgi:hypothetical protein